LSLNPNVIGNRFLI